MRRLISIASCFIVLIAVIGSAKAASRPAEPVRTIPSMLDTGPPLPELEFPSPLPPKHSRPHREISSPVAPQQHVSHPWPHAPACCGPSAAEVEGMISATFGAYASSALAVANCESHYDWQAQNSGSGASGIFQFIPDWWWNTDTGKYKWNVWDAQANISMAYSASSGGTNWSAWSCKP